MKVEELDCGNREVVRLDGKQANVKSVSPGTEMCYQAGGMDELAQYSEVTSSVLETQLVFTQGDLIPSGYVMYFAGAGGVATLNRSANCCNVSGPTLEQQLS